VTYPPGAGPDGGRFDAVPWFVGQQLGDAAPSATSPAARPRPLVDEGQGVSNGAGSQVYTLGPAPSSGWLVRRMSVWASSPCTAGVYVGAEVRLPWVSVTYAGDGDEWDGNQPLYVPPDQSLFIVWALAAGDTRSRVEYEEIV
jgi:hypothetical protein